MSLLVPCSVGDLLDRVTILRIKVARVGDAARANVQRELDQLTACWPALAAGDEAEMAELTRVNRALWDVEDRLRASEAAGEFGAAFIEDARSVYRLNDRRAAVKRALNVRLGSDLVEEKLHPVYR